MNHLSSSDIWCPRGVSAYTMTSRPPLRDLRLGDNSPHCSIFSTSTIACENSLGDVTLSKRACCEARKDDRLDVVINSISFVLLSTAPLKTRRASGLLSTKRISVISSASLGSLSSLGNSTTGFLLATGAAERLGSNRPTMIPATSNMHPINNLAA